MSKRSLEVSMMTLIKRHGLPSVEAAVRMYKAAMQDVIVARLTRKAASATPSSTSQVDTAAGLLANGSSS